MSEGLVLLTVEETPIYFNPSPTKEDEIRLHEKYKGKCLFELYETSEIDSVDDESKKFKNLARYIVVWDSDLGHPLTIVDGAWIEDRGCVSNAVVAQGASDEIREQYKNWFKQNRKEDQGPIGLGFDSCTVGVIPPNEIPVDRSQNYSVEEAKKAVQTIFDTYFAGPQ